MTKPLDCKGVDVGVKMQEFIVDDNGDFEWVTRSGTPDIYVSPREICEMLNSRPSISPETVRKVREAISNLIDNADFDQQAYDDGKYGGCFGYTDNTKKLIAEAKEALALLEESTTPDPQILVDVLEFYADKNNHLPQEAFKTAYSGRYMSNIEVNDDMGRKAREALKQWRGG